MTDQQSPKFRVLRMVCDPQRRHALRDTPLTAADVMSSPAITVSSAYLLRDVVQLISVHEIRHVLVTDASKLVGVISDRDVLRVLWKGRPTLDHPVTELASVNLQIASPDTPIETIASMTLGGRISSVPIVNANGEPLGIVTSSDLAWLLKEPGRDWEAIDESRRD